jgi:hypothetical protein
MTKDLRRGEETKSTKAVRVVPRAMNRFDAAMELFPLNQFRIQEANSMQPVQLAKSASQTLNFVQ